MRTNVTVSVDSSLLREVKILAARRGQSISGLLSEALEQSVRSDKAYEAARQRATARLRESTDLGWKRPASRQALHERGA